MDKGVKVCHCAPSSASALRFSAAVCTPGEDLPIFVKALIRKTLTLQTLPSESISDVKFKLEGKESEEMCWHKCDILMVWLGQGQGAALVCPLQPLS